MVTPCIKNYGTEKDIMDFLDLKRAGVYAIGGDKWAESKKTICEKLSEEKCQFYSMLPDGIEAGPIKSMQWAMQNYVEGLKEPIEIEDYVAGKRDSPAIDLGNVRDTLPITFFIAEGDQVCPPEDAEWIYDQMTNADIDITYDEGFDHGTYNYVGSQEFVDKICQYIERGAIRAEHHDDEGDMW